jgi:hypothetical protein
MKLSKGQANPKLVNQLLNEKLNTWVHNTNKLNHTNARTLEKNH